MLTAYPKIFTIGTDYIRDIFNGEVEITEKIDGSQFGFGNIDGEIFIRSKSKQLFPEAPEKMFSIGIEYISKIKHYIPKGYGFYCEYLQKPKHNLLSYGRVPQNNLILFGVVDIKRQKFQDNIEEFAKILGIEHVPILYKGIISSPESLLELLKTESILGNCTIEGVVVKNYNIPFLLGGQPIPLMSGKFVSEAFKEKHKIDWKENKTTKGSWEKLLESYRTEARWMKSIQHLRDSGELENQPRDIGKLIKEITRDLEEEEIDSIKNDLYTLFIKDIKRKSTAGFPEFYKEYLLKNSLDNQ